MNELEARRPKLSNPLARRIAAVGRETYNPGLGKQQGTTFTIYDTISLTGSPNVLNFFENLNNKGFPFTNLTRNSFTDAEAMVVQRAYLTLIRINNTTEYQLLAGNNVEIFELDAMANLAIEYKKVSLSQGSILVSGQEVLKNFSFLAATAAHNYGSKFKSLITADEAGQAFGHNVYTFATSPSIPPNREFKVPVQIPSYTEQSGATNTDYIRLTLEGFGAIPSVQGTL